MYTQMIPDFCTISPEFERGGGQFAKKSQAAADQSFVYRAPKYNEWGINCKYRLPKVVSLCIC